MGELALTEKILLSRSIHFGAQPDHFCALCRQSFKRSELHNGVMGAFSYCTSCLLKVSAAYRGYTVTRRLPSQSAKNQLRPACHKARSHLPHARGGFPGFRVFLQRDLH